MDYSLPDLKLEQDWGTQREAWIRLAEDCLYGHAPEGAAAEGRIVRSKTLWNGLVRKELVRISYGAGSFDAVIYAPAAPGVYPAVTWNQFSKHDWLKCP